MDVYVCILHVPLWILKIQKSYMPVHKKYIYENIINNLLLNH